MTGAPIGIFDSGLGGLTVLKSLVRRFPWEGTVYFGDSGRAPYGTKSHDTIVRFAVQDLRFLLSQGVKVCVIACNTASAHAFEDIRNRTDIPVVEVIGPGARAAVAATRNGRIGVIGTPATIGSGVYRSAIEAAGGSSVRVFSQACPLFVGLAEEGWWDTDVTRRVAEIYLEPLAAAGVDTLVLGCTHYPLLASAISRVMGPSVRLIDSADEVTAEVARLLSLTGLAADESGRPGLRRFYTSDSPDRFRELGQGFLETPIDHAGKVEIEAY
mgnify:CR=1 FL=1